MGDENVVWLVEYVDRYESKLRLTNIFSSRLTALRYCDSTLRSSREQTDGLEFGFTKRPHPVQGLGSSGTSGVHSCEYVTDGREWFYIHHTFRLS
jgi:hypothetical protein